MFREIKRPSRLFEEVATQIEQVIVERKLKVGERLPSEAALSKEFSISKRTLREAIRVVEQKGLVEITLNGIYVKDASTCNLSENLALLLKRHQVDWKHITNFRSILDCSIASLAAQNATDDDISDLESLLAEGDGLLGKKPLDWEKYLDVDIKIHLKLAKMSGNPINEWILSTFLKNMSDYYDTYTYKENQFSHENWQNQKRLVQAIKDKNPKEAARQAQAHLELGSKHVGGFRNKALGN